MSIESKIHKNIGLAPLTTFKIGGPAKFFIEAKTKEDLKESFEWAKENNHRLGHRHSGAGGASGTSEKIFILAGGSNVLINDKGLDGLVIKISNNNIKVRGERLDCGAGVNLGKAVSMATSENLTGLEWAIGIPGTVGGAIRGNAGAFGDSISELVETLEVFNKEDLSFKTFSRRDCDFNYRESIFKNNVNFFIWEAVLRLNYGEVKEIKSKTEEYLKYRTNYQPKLPSAGSVFKNIKFSELKKNNFKLAERAESEGAVKGGMIGAGWIIDFLGFKGKIIGGAKISLEHANFIVNTGKATAEDVIMLISYIKQQVRDRFKIQLHEEVQYVGF